MIVERYLTAPYVSLTTILFNWFLGHQLTGAMSHFFIFPLLKGTFHWCWTMKPCQGIKFLPPIYMLTLIIITYSASHSSEYFLLKLKYAKESVGPHWKNMSVMWAKKVLLCSLIFVCCLFGRFPEGSLYTNTNDEGWKMIRVGDTPLGFGVFSLNISVLWIVLNDWSVAGYVIELIVIIFITVIVIINMVIIVIVMTMVDYEQSLFFL